MRVQTTQDYFEGETEELSEEYIVPATVEESLESAEDIENIEKKQILNKAKKGKSSYQKVEKRQVMIIAKALFPFLLLVIFIFVVTRGILWTLQYQTENYCAEVYKEYGEHFADER